MTHKDYLIKYYKKKPWIKTYLRIVTRCIYDKNNKYFKKKIKNFLTTSDLEYLWYRDKAYLMEKASIDRINPDKNYSLENCQYMEFKKNSGKKRTQNQYTIKRRM